MDPVPEPFLMKSTAEILSVPRSNRPSLIKDCTQVSAPLFKLQAITLALQDALAKSQTHPHLFTQPLATASDSFCLAAPIETTLYPGLLPLG